MEIFLDEENENYILKKMCKLYNERVIFE